MGFDLFRRIPKFLDRGLTEGLKEFSDTLRSYVGSFETYPLLSCSDIEELLRHFLPKRAVIKEDVIAQMEKRHEKRLATIQHAYIKQRITLLE